MAPRVTNSRDRSRRRSTRPVTTSRGRANRQGVSNAQVTQGSNGRPRYPNRNNPSNQVTNSRQRPAGGNARVTRGAGARPELPPAGGTTGNSPRAQNQAAWARDRGARAQLGRTINILTRGAARGLGLDRQSQAQGRLNSAAQGTRGDGVRVVGPGGANPKGQPRLPAGRNAGALPPGRQGGALANRPAGGSLANRPGGRSGALANRSNSSLANRPNSSPVDGRLVGVNVAEVRRRPRLEGQRALPSGQQSLPAGQRGGDLANRPGGQRALPPGRQGGALTARPSSGGGGSRSQPSSGRPALPPGRQGGSLTTTPSRADSARARAAAAAAGSRGAGVRTGQPGSSSGSSRINGRIGATSVRGAAVEGLLAGFLTPAVQAAGRSAGQWIGRNVLLPMVDRNEDKTPGIQSPREARRRAAASLGSRQGPPVPERLRRAAAAQSSASRPSGSGQGSPSRPSASSQGAASRPSSRPSSSPSQPAAATRRPQGQASAPSGMTGDPMSGRTGQFDVEGSPLTAEPAPLPGQRPQAPVTAGSRRPSFVGPGAPQPLPGASQGASGTPTPTQAQSPVPGSPVSESARTRGQSSSSRPSRAPSRAPTLDGSLDSFRSRNSSGSAGGIQRDARAPKKNTGNSLMKIATEKRKKARQN